MDNQVPIRLLKSETGLPANILDVQYYFTVEFGMMIYIVVQNDTLEELNEKKSFWLFFTEDADDFFYTPGEPDSLSEKDFNKMKDYVKKSYADNNSLLAKLFEQRKKEWEAENPETVVFLNNLNKGS
ncbi:hypothetical protein MSI_24220 [Treponema sp. JC4]|uniref:hypothetical protein n=1 Tax=Treponema sp. JC4 TaxID=1124982 RepID=UPI00025B0CCC|nr:hypothetical protein [Treponema sp. JC4]EID84128.1 hypothetical protein MSI_24220 [Treponema sp. JC4]